jgi:O-antigen/teichoic acid export membrane protein
MLKKRNTPKQPSSFFSDVIKLTSGNIISQGFVILVAPILTRLFSPEAFGVAALLSSISALISVLASLRYEVSILLPKTDDEAANLLSVSLCFVLLFSSVTALIVFVTGGFFSAILNTPILQDYFWVIPLAVFSQGLSYSLTYWNTRTKHFSLLSIVRVIRSITARAGKLVGGFSGFASGGLLFGADVFSYIVFGSILGFKVWRNNRSLFRASIRWNRMVEGAKRYKNFPIYSTWSALLNTASQQLPALLLAFFFSPQIVGFFAIGLQVIILPINLIGRSISQVFFQKASEAKYEGQLGRVAEEVFGRLVSLGMFPFLLSAVLGKDLLSFVFGFQWSEAGVYVQVLSLSAFFAFISLPISTLFSVLEAQKEETIFNIFFFISRAVSLGIGGVAGDPRIAVSLFAITDIIALSWMCSRILDMADASLVKCVVILFQHFFISFPLLAGIIWFRYIVRLNFYIIFGLGLFCAIFYYAIILYRDVNMRAQVVSLLMRSHSLRRRNLKS